MRRHRDFHVDKLTEAERAKVGSMSVTARKAMIDDMHVEHPGFEKGLEFVRSRQFPVAGAPHDVGKFHFLGGSYRSGKTRVVEFHARAENVSRATDGVTPVVHVECAEGWGAKQVMIAIIEELVGAAPSDRFSLSLLTNQVMAMIEKFHVELVVIDDIGEVLLRRGGQQAGPLLTNLKRILDRRTCNVLGVGPVEVVPMIKERHGYIGGRGGLLNHVATSPDWHVGDDRDSYALMLNGMDDLLPFRRKSGLGIPRYAAHFFDMSGGSPGYTAAYVTSAAYKALADGSDRIEHRHLVETAVEARAPEDAFTHFVDPLEDKLVGRRRSTK